LDALVSQCDTKKVVLQVDFSENGTIMSQNEVQSAHWCHGQATLFTAHAWIEEGKTEKIVLISYELNHTKHSIYVYMVHIMKLLKRKYPSIEVQYIQYFAHHIFCISKLYHILHRLYSISVQYMNIRFVFI